MTFAKNAVPAPLYLTLLLQFLTPTEAVPTPTSTPALPNLPPEYDISMNAVSPSGGGTARISFNTQPNGQGYTLLIQPDGLRLLRRTDTSEEDLATSAGTGMGAARQNPMKVLIQRRKGRITVLEDAHLVLTVEDNAFNGGNGDLATAGDAAVTELKAQPREPLYFTDDFMRQPTEQGDWTYDQGQWRIQTVGNIKWGANPFSLVSTPNPAGMASAGYSFWSDYSFRAAVKGSPGAALGICVDLKDKNNYYLLRWGSGATGALELQRVVEGKATTLQSVKGGFIPNLWYEIGLKTSGGRLMAEVDHQEIMSARDATLGAGRIGLFSEGKESSPVWFDSIIAQPSGLVEDNFAGPSTHRWQIEGEKALGGSPDWQNYTVTAEVTGAHQIAGIPFHYHDPQNYDVFAWDAAGAKLFAVNGGARTLLASSPTGLAPGSLHTVEAGVRDGYLWGTVDGKKVVEGLDTSLQSGQAGFQPAAGAGKFIRSISIRVDEKPEPTDSLTDEFTQFTHHFDMRDWAGPLHAWEQPTSFGKDNGIWHKGNLYGDTTISIPLNAKNRQNGQFAVVLNGDGKTSDSGYQLDYAAKGDGEIMLQLLRQGQPVAEGHSKVPMGADAVPLDIRRQGPFVTASLAHAPVLAYQDPEPLDGYRRILPVDFAPDEGGHSRYGLIQRGDTQLDIPLITVTNRNVYSETFHLAPVNWRPQSGAWDVTSRWSCTPGWTWYGGKGTGYSANWHKAPLWGDQSIDYYAAAMMAATAASGAETWQDLNCAFCADGVNLFSGYTLIVGGWGNTASRLFRKGHVVAENTTFHFPPAGVAHRMWYDVHTEKQGGHIQINLSTVDTSQQHQEYKLLDWTDPEPLAGGFTGFWTYNNGMMVARTVLSAEQKAPVAYYTANPTWLAQQPPSTPYPLTPDAGGAAVALLPAGANTLPSFTVPHFSPSLLPSAPGSIFLAGAPVPVENASGGPSFLPVAPVSGAPTNVSFVGSANLSPAQPPTAETIPNTLEPTSRPVRLHLPGKKAAVMLMPGSAAAGPRPTVQVTPAVPGTTANTTPNPPSAGAQAAPGTITVSTQPVELQAQNLTMTVEPGGILSHIRFKGREVVRQVLLDIRSAEWHQVKLTPDNTQVQVVKGPEPTVTIQFQVHSADLNLSISGRETVRIVPGDILRVQAALEPGTSFQSNRVSLNLVVPAGDYAGKQARTTSSGADRMLSIPTQPLFPIKMAENITHLALPDPGIEVRPTEGTGVFEDLRHYSLDELWFEQQAAYPYPHVQQGDRKRLGMDVHFGSP